MNKPRLLSLCSGIGAIDLAAQKAGIEIAGQVEIDQYCCAVLLKNFGDVPRKHDIREVEGDEFGTIDIVAGGIPCQPFSNAGQQRGRDDDRYLWPEMFRIVKKARPTWLVIENVDDFTYMALDDVSSDLESENYTVQAFVLPACATGAPHIRERCFVVAYFSGERGRARGTEPARQQGQTNAHSTGEAIMAHTQSTEQQWSGDTRNGWDGFANVSSGMAHATSREDGRLQQRGVQTHTSPSGVGLADTNSARLEIRDGRHTTRGTCAAIDGYSAWSTQPRMGRNVDGAASGMDGHIWPTGPGQAQNPNEPPRTVTGKQPYRNQRLKALGNAVVPQQVYPFFAAIMACYTAEEIPA